MSLDLARRLLLNPAEPQVIYFFRRAGDTRSYETRLQLDGPGYELVVRDGGESIEAFDDIKALVARQEELRRAWNAHGWKDVTADDRVKHAP